MIERQAKLLKNCTIFDPVQSIKRNLITNYDYISDSDSSDTFWQNCGSDSEYEFPAITRKRVKKDFVCKEGPQKVKKIEAEMPIMDKRNAKLFEEESEDTNGSIKLEEQKQEPEEINSLKEEKHAVIENITELIKKDTEIQENNILQEDNQLVPENDTESSSQEKQLDDSETLISEIPKLVQEEEKTQSSSQNNTEQNNNQNILEDQNKEEVQPTIQEKSEEIPELLNIISLEQSTMIREVEEKKMIKKEFYTRRNRHNRQPYKYIYKTNSYRRYGFTTPHNLTRHNTEREDISAMPIIEESAQPSQTTNPLSQLQIELQEEQANFGSFGFHDFKFKASENTEKICCPICTFDLNNGDDVRILSCLHIFHKHCLEKWMENSTMCPIDKIKIF